MVKVFDSTAYTAGDGNNNQVYKVLRNRTVNFVDHSKVKAMKAITKMVKNVSVFFAFLGVSTISAALALSLFYNQSATVKKMKNNNQTYS